MLASIIWRDLVVGILKSVPRIKGTSDRAATVKGRSIPKKIGMRRKNTLRLVCDAHSPSNKMERNIAARIHAGPLMGTYQKIEPKIMGMISENPVVYTIIQTNDLLYVCEYTRKPKKIHLT